MNKKQYYNKITELNEMKSNGTLVVFDIDDRIRELKSNFEEQFLGEVLDSVEETLRTASENGNTLYSDIVVFLTPEGKITGANLPAHTRQHTKNSKIEIFRLSSDF